MDAESIELRIGILDTRLNHALDARDERKFYFLCQERRRQKAALRRVLEEAAGETTSSL